MFLANRTLTPRIPRKASTFNPETIAPSASPAPPGERAGSGSGLTDASPDTVRRTAGRSASPSATPSCRTPGWPPDTPGMGGGQDVDHPLRAAAPARRRRGSRRYYLVSFSPCDAARRRRHRGRCRPAGRDQALSGTVRAESTGSDRGVPVTRVAVTTVAVANRSEARKKLETPGLAVDRRRGANSATTVTRQSQKSPHTRPRRHGAQRGEPMRILVRGRPARSVR